MSHALCIIAKTGDFPINNKKERRSPGKDKTALKRAKSVRFKRNTHTHIIGVLCLQGENVRNIAISKTQGMGKKVASGKCRRPVILSLTGLLLQ